MRWIDLLRMSSGNLRRRKLRTFLTVLGVVVGTASIVVMISLGLGMQQSLYREIEQSGGMTAITVTGKDAGNQMIYMGDDSEGEATKYITDEAIQELSEVGHVKSATPTLTMSSIILTGEYYGYIQLVGLTPEEIERQNMNLVEGSKFPEEGAANLELIFGNGVGTMFYEKGTDRGYWDTQQIPDIDYMNDQMFLILDQAAYFDSLYNNGAGMGQGNGQEGQTQQVKPPKKYVVHGSGLVAGDINSYNANYYNVYCDINALKRMLQKEYAGRAIPGQPTTKTGKIGRAHV